MHQLVNKNFDSIKMHGMTVENTKCYLLMQSMLYGTFFSSHSINYRLSKKLTTQNNTSAIFWKNSKWNGEVTLDQYLIVTNIKFT